LVEFHRLSGIVFKVDIWVELGWHNSLLGGMDA
jgi:hypothetical protein